MLLCETDRDRYGFKLEVTAGLVAHGITRFEGERGCWYDGEANGSQFLYEEFLNMDR